MGKINVVVLLLIENAYGVTSVARRLPSYNAYGVTSVVRRATELYIKVKGAAFKTTKLILEIKPFPSHLST